MSESPKKTRGLGRGLSTLMSDIAPVSAERADTESSGRETVVAIDRIVANPDQPRRTFDDEAIAELANSIAEKGVIQPLILRPDPSNRSRFQIVAGERRWRAAQIAQLHELPVIIRDYTDTEMLEVAIIENIQRADLNPIDEAAGYRQLMDRFGHTQEILAQALGKSRSHIANQLRLLSLPPEIQDYLADGRLTSGHARPLIGHPDALEIAAQAIRRKLSVRDVEKMTKSRATRTSRNSQARSADKDADTKLIEQELSAALKMRVTIDHDARGGGRLTLAYTNLEQLDDLLRALSGS